MAHTRATVVITHDDVNDYFLFINLATGNEIGRRSTEDYGTWSYDDGYDEEQMTRKIAIELGVNEYTTIHW